MYCIYPAKMDVMQTAEPTANPANSPTCIHNGAEHVSFVGFTMGAR
jgi:hypothetical protein